MSSLVRDGKMSYKDAIKVETVDENSFAMKDSLLKIGLKKIDLE